MRPPTGSLRKSGRLLLTPDLLNLFGTTLSGWLTDRFDPRKLLFFY